MVKDRNRLEAKVCITVFLLAVLFTVGAFVFSNTNIWEHQGDKPTLTVTPDRVERVDEDTVEYVFYDLPADRSRDSIGFRTNHHTVKAYIDGELVYILQRDKGAFGRTTGYCWNSVNITEGRHEVKIAVTALYPQSRGYEIGFSFGHEKTMYAEMLRKSMVPALFCLFNIGIGSMLLFYWFITRKKLHRHDILYLGIFAVSFGLWSCMNTDMGLLLIKNRQGAIFTEYASLMMLSPTFALFSRDFMEAQYRRTASFIAGIGFAMLPVLMILQLTGLRGLKQNVIFIHVMIAVSFLYMLGCIISYRIRKGVDLRFISSLLGMGALLVAGILSITSYYKYSMSIEVGYLGRSPMLIYIVFIGIVTWREAIQAIELGREAEIYKNLALRDILTGLYSRNAYNKWVETCTDLSGVSLLIFDLNTLKACNDIFGHSCGDQYIINAADLLRRVFNKVGNCYRIGGDEFCVILRDVSDEKIRKLLEQLRKLEEKCVFFEGAEKGSLYGLAKGYATYDPSIDENIEMTRARADEMMYKDKGDRKRSV